MNTDKPTRAQYETKEGWRRAMITWYKDRIKPEDIVVTTPYHTECGIGGMHTHVTGSSVTVTHKPLSMSVTVKTHRSQHRNRDDALRTIAEELWKLDVEPTETIP